MPTPRIEDYGLPEHPVVVITGPRGLEDRVDVFRVALTKTFAWEFNAGGEFTLVHGAAKGVDSLGGLVAEDMRIPSIPVPFFGWLRGGGGPARNKFMLVEYSPRRLHGFHYVDFEDLPRPGSGTADCFHQGLKLGIEAAWHNVTANTVRFYNRGR